MSFASELAHPRAVFRPYLRFAGTENPTISGVIGGETPNLYGHGADNTGETPVKNTVESFGRFSRSIANDRIALETPKTRVSLRDWRNQWKRWNARPFLLTDRKMSIVGRIKPPNGVHIDERMLHGIAKDFEHRDGITQFTLYDTFGEFFGLKTPRDRVTLDDWPNAHPNAISRVVPLVYGKVENNLTPVQFGSGEGSITIISEPERGGNDGGAGVYEAGYGYLGGYQPSGVTASEVLSAGTLDATLGPLQVMVTTVDPSGYESDPAPFYGTSTQTDTPVQVTMSGPSGAILATCDPAPAGYEYRFYLGHYYYGWRWHVMVQSATPSVTFTSLEPTSQAGGQAIISDTINYYEIWGIYGDNEAYTETSFLIQAVNRGLRRPNRFTWLPLTGVSISAYGVRVRGAGGGWYRKWTVPTTQVNALGNIYHEDNQLNNTGEAISEGTTPVRAGAVEALYVDTNPSGTDTFKYAIARHACDRVPNVYVTKTPITERGTPVGSLARPTRITAVVSGTPGTTSRRYAVTAVNSIGETDPGTILVSKGPDELSEGDSITLDWIAVEGATSYRIYRSDEGEDFVIVEELENGGPWTDTGATTGLFTRTLPETNTTGTHFDSNEGPTSDIPLIQRLGIDYDITHTVQNGKSYTLIHFYKDQGEHLVTADVWGVEPEGDGTGEAIQGLFDQFLHYLLNFVFNDYKTGAYFQNTGGIRNLINKQSFLDAQEKSIERVSPSGYIGAIAMSEEQDIKQAIYDWLLCSDVDMYYWDGKLKVSLPDKFLSVPDTANLTHLSLQNAVIREGSFTSWVDDSQVWSVLPWQAGPQEAGFLYSGRATYPGIDVEAELGKPREAPMLTLRWLRHERTINNVMARKAKNAAVPTGYGEFTVPIQYAVEELSSEVSVDHPDGISESENGWEDRVCKLLRTDLDVTKKNVIFLVEDIAGRVAALGVDPVVLAEEHMASVILGGNRHASVVDAGDGANIYRPYSWVEGLVPWAVFETNGLTVAAQARAMVKTAAGTVILKLYNESGVLVADGTSTPITSSSFTEFLVTLPATTVTHRYHFRVFLSGGASPDTVYVVQPEIILTPS